MKLPQHLIENICFSAENAEKLIAALGETLSQQDADDIRKLYQKGLPPVVSEAALCTMIGINEGLLYSLLRKQTRYYRVFPIPKGKSVRRIQAPKIALKVIQKWLSFHIAKIYNEPSHVYGFVKSKSHILAAKQHLEAKWVYSIDIDNFFPSISYMQVVDALAKLGYPAKGAFLIGKIATLVNALPQGSPLSPTLSNLCFIQMDENLKSIADKYDVKLTRYADDIVFSGSSKFDHNLKKEVELLFENSNWKIASHKTELSMLPNRLKVHGLLVHGREVRLTKGYRNRIRALTHLQRKGMIRPQDQTKIAGHINYSNQVSSINN